MSPPRSRPNPAVVCAGHVNWDVTLRVDRLPAPDAEARIGSRRCGGGGSAANAAVALAGLGVTSGVIGSVGDDRVGRLACRELRAAGVDVGGVATVDRPTSVKYLVVDPEGRLMVLSNDGANEARSPDDVDPAYLRAADHLHLTGQSPATAAALADRAAAAGLSVSFDPGRRLVDRDHGAVLSRADVVFLNEREAESAPAAGLDAAADGSIVVRKRGERGALVDAPGGRHAHPGFSVDAVDTTGAGDAFAAGFLASALRGGALPPAAPTAETAGARGAASDSGAAGADGAGGETGTGTEGVSGTDGGGSPLEVAGDGRPAVDFGAALAVANACGALATCREGARLRPTWSTVGSFLADRDAHSPK